MKSCFNSLSFTKRESVKVQLLAKVSVLAIALSTAFVVHAADGLETVNSEAVANSTVLQERSIAENAFSEDLSKKIASDLGVKNKPLSNSATVLPRDNDDLSYLKKLNSDNLENRDVTASNTYRESSSASPANNNNNHKKSFKFQFIEEPSLTEFTDYTVKPINFGQDYIGLATLREYEEYWQQRILDLGIAQKCRYFLGQNSFTVYGSECIQLNNFDRLEAHADESGKLASILFTETIENDQTHQDILDILQLRYEHLSDSKLKASSISDVYALNNDLCFVMTRLARANYRCNVNWYRHNDIYISYTHSIFKGVAKANLLYASEKYLKDVESALLKRRLALIRQEMDRNLTVSGKPHAMTAYN